MTLTEKYVNPFTDFGFKKLFGTELNKDLLIHFLNEVILPPKFKIRDLEYRSLENLGQTIDERRAIFDLYCLSESGERFIVEMQKAKQNYFKDRSVFYSTFPIQEQALKGKWDFKLSAIYTVGILDFVFSEENSEKNNKARKNEVRHVVKLKNQNCKVFYDKLTLIYLEMPHFTKKEEELETTYDKWLYVLKYLPRLTSRPEKLQEKIFKRLFEAAEIAKFTPVEKNQYEESIKIYRDLINVIDTAHGDGEIKGLKEGILKGKLEEKRINIIKALQRGKLSIAEIAEDYNVTFDYIEMLHIELNS